MLFLLFRFVLFRIHFSLVRLVRHLHLLDALLPISLNSRLFRWKQQQNILIFICLICFFITIRLVALVIVCICVCVCIYVFQWFRLRCSDCVTFDWISFAVCSIAQFEYDSNSFKCFWLSISVEHYYGWFSVKLFCSKLVEDTCGFVSTPRFSIYKIGPHYVELFFCFRLYECESDMRVLGLAYL